MIEDDNIYNSLLGNEDDDEDEDFFDGNINPIDEFEQIPGFDEDIDTI